MFTRNKVINADNINKNSAPDGLVNCVAAVLAVANIVAIIAAVEICLNVVFFIILWYFLNCLAPV